MITITTDSKQDLEDSYYFRLHKKRLSEQLTKAIDEQIIKDLAELCKKEINQL